MAIDFDQPLDFGSTPQSNKVETSKGFSTDAPLTFEDAPDNGQKPSRPPRPEIKDMPDIPKNLSTKELLSNAWENAKTEAPEVGEGLLNVVKHPIDTAKSLIGFGKGMGEGLYSKASGALGAEQNPENKKQTEAMLNAFIDSPHEWYDAVVKGDTKELKKLAYYRPLSAALDVASVIPYVGLAGKGTQFVGETAKIASLAKAGEIAAKAANAIDPVNLALKGTGKVIDAAVAIPRAATWITTGVSPKTQKIVAAAATTADKTLKDAYLAAHKTGDARPLYDSVINSVQKIAQKESDSFADNLAKAGNNAPVPSWTPIQQAISDARKSYTAGGVRTGEFSREHAILDQIESTINGKIQNGVKPTFQNFNDLKKAVAEAGRASPAHPPEPAAMKIYGAFGDEIRRISPKYDDLMTQWQTHLSNMRELQRQLGASRTSDASRVLNKVLRSEKSPNGKRLIDAVSKEDPKIPFMLAGHLTHDWTRHGSISDAFRNIGLPTAFLSGYGGHALGLLTASSPKLAGKVNYLGAKALSNLGQGARFGILPAYTATGQLIEADQKASSTSTPGKQSDSQTPDLSNLIQRMAQVESGNLQFDKEGRTITSPKNAVGVMQVTDAAHQDVAKKLGVPFDPQRLRTDEKYNRLIGETYFKMMVDRFKSPELAVAAYNGGPGRVEYALEQSKKRGGQWLDYMPPETQDYYRKVFGKTASATGGRIQRASGGRAGMNHITRAAMLIRAAERAKNQHSDDTEPLLNQPDESIAKALKVANSAI